MNTNNKITYGASVFDFDETVGLSNNVVWASKNGSVIKITSDEWPTVGEQMHEWLIEQNIKLKLDNIVGLGNSTGEAKAKWIQDNLISNGVNDIYFVDDAFSNVKAVKDMFNEYPKGFLIKGGKSIITN